MMRDKEITDRRGAVLSAALELFSEKGYFNTSVHDIERRANVSIGAIYHHFGSKETIAKALFEHVESMMSDVFSDIIADNAAVQDRCKAVIAYFFELTEKHEEVMNYMMYARHRDIIPEAIPVCSSRPFLMMKEVVEEGIAVGDIRPVDPAVAVSSIFGGAVRLIFLKLDGVLENPLPSYLEECWECAWRSVAA